MTTSIKRHICIVGDGFAAAVGIIRLLHHVSTPLQITVVGRRESIGRGIAYSTEQIDHLVNGPAKNFGVVPEQPDHLTRWVTNRVLDLGWNPPDDVAASEVFVPRSIYGTYVQEVLEESLRAAAGRVEIQHVRQGAVDARVEDGGYVVTLDSGRHVSAEFLVIATGLFQRPPLTIGRGANVAAAYSRLMTDPWNVRAWERLARVKDILLVGSGLTSLDLMINAEAAGFRGNYHLISRRGILVQKRAEVPAWPQGLNAGQLPETLRDLQREARRIRREIKTQGGHPQQIASTLRPHLPALWGRSSLRDKQRFIKYLRPFWENSLHRAAPESGQRLTRIKQQGRLHQKVGHLVALTQTDSASVEVTWRARGSEKALTFRVDWVAAAHGYEFDWGKVQDPLVRNLIERGMVTPHATRFGVEARPETGQLLNASGQLQPALFAIGHPLRGASWESNSIGEQLAQASNAAATIAARILQSDSIAPHPEALA